MDGTGCFGNLLVWQRSRRLAAHLYQVTESLPKSEQFGLTSQIRRAAVSVPTNIAEGRSRLGPRGFLHFLEIARGSLAELETLLIISADIGLISDISIELAECDEIGKMIYGLQAAVKSRSQEA